MKMRSRGPSRMRSTPTVSMQGTRRKKTYIMIVTSGRKLKKLTYLLIVMSRDEMKKDIHNDSDEQKKTKEIDILIDSDEQQLQPSQSTRRS